MTLNISRPLIIGKIIQLEGQCLIKREYESNYVPIRVDQEVHEGDLIKPEPNAIAIIQFINCEILWRVPSGIESGVMNGYPLSRNIIESPSGKLLHPH